MVPTAIFALVGYVIGYIFMAVYGTTSEAILMIFTMDEEIEKSLGNSEAANCPAPLQDFLKEHA